MLRPPALLLLLLQPPPPPPLLMSVVTLPSKVVSKVLSRERMIQRVSQDLFGNQLSLKTD